MILSQKSDTFGAIASTLCLIHCISTPFIFALQTCSASCCKNSPGWWQAIDYLFLGISFFAVWQSARTTSKHWVAYALWASWIGIFVVLLNEKLAILPVLNHLLYVPALTLVVLHLYNQKYCHCSGTECCNFSTNSKEVS
ncbi:MerC domain-containing protein [Aureispira anguillae]|uniref:MerC domain-containing protein n=1 Tax=Aureispira anguillae TaxID=2864201 RepID=A0A915YEC6_9BACT|nr:MerC domain-containing protein [Aureispira anguillae]BDS11567.1 MerC domain-containing protein [Aureispira anguillae]